jgi:aldose 1-epimerase
VILRCGDQANGFAVDTDAGGRICSLVLAGRERILREPAAGVVTSFAWGSFLMAPFVGRVKDGLLTWRGRTVRLPLNLAPHAIHGAVFDVPWQVAEHGPSAITMTCRFDPARWPFEGEMTQTLEIEAGRLILRAEVLAEEPMPAALGWHPWFADPQGQMRVRLQSDAILRLAPDLIPTGETAAVDERTDLRDGPGTGGRRLDDVYVAVGSPAVVTWPDIELTMDFEQPIGSFVICTHPQAVCVEPMTAWPDAVRLAGEGHADTGLVELASGERLAASTTWSWRPIER